MTKRLGIIFLVGIMFFGCYNSDNGTSAEEPSARIAEKRTVKSADNISIVCGVFFEVSDFDVWLNEYNKPGKNNIITLRNVHDPKMVVVFESMPSLEAAKSRASSLCNQAFISRARLMGKPAESYYEVQYYITPIKDYKYYLAFTFMADDTDLWLESLDTNMIHFNKNGLTPMGIGTNPGNASEVYMLLTLKDFVEFRKRNNAPRKLKHLLEELGLPENTVISYWAKHSL
jgi:hypothetical protein